MPTSQPMSAQWPILRGQPVKPPKRQVPAQVEYPESDGKPMSETPIHWRATVDFAQPLMDRYAARPDAYVGSDMLMFWEEGDPKQRVSPDVFVAFGPRCDPERRIWRVWEEGKAADFVLEVTSKSTRRKDEGFKAKLYERLGVTEYWQFDPTEDYLRPNLKGRRLRPDGVYAAIELESRNGALMGWSAVLGLELRPEGKALRLFDPEAGAFLLPSAEKSRVIGEQARTIDEQVQTIAAAKAERDAEAKARRDAEARIAALERRLDRSR